MLVGMNSGARLPKRKFALLFINGDRGRIVIVPAVVAVWRPAQLMLCWITVAITPVQTISWSIPMISGIRVIWKKIVYSISIEYKGGAVNSKQEIYVYLKFEFLWHMKRMLSLDVL